MRRCGRTKRHKARTKRLILHPSAFPITTGVAASSARQRTARVRRLPCRPCVQRRRRQASCAAAMQAFLETDTGGVAWVLEYVRALRNGRLKPYNFVERKTRAATRGSTPWGPTGEQLRELAAASHQDDCLAAIFSVLVTRARARGAKWRKAYKALLVLEWLATRGSAAAATRAQGMRYVVEDLMHFTWEDPDTGKDEVRALSTHGTW